MGLKSFYDRHIMPSVVHLACSTKPVRYQRRKVVPHATGRVLEIGFGSGLNLPFYDAAKVSELIALEPDARMRAKAAQRVAEAGMPINFLDLSGEEIPLDDGSIDTVLVTYTLCTIPDAVKALGEMRRVLKPGGRMLFCEHGRAPDAGVARWQERITPTWRALAGGCHLGRDIPRLIEEGGFTIRQLDEMYLPSTPRIAGYNYWGAAEPRS
jgi:ubiquinone/menaquinone biosynthesis C-methylase UbiE